MKNTNFSGSGKPWQSTGHSSWARTCLKQLYVSTTVCCLYYRSWTKQVCPLQAQTKAQVLARVFSYALWIDSSFLRIVVDSIARVVCTTKLSQLLHTLAPAFNSSALINHANKLKETALHMTCMMERSKVTSCLWMHASGCTGNCSRLRAALS